MVFAKEELRHGVKPQIVLLVWQSARAGVPGESEEKGGYSGILDTLKCEMRDAVFASSSHLNIGGIA